MLPSNQEVSAAGELGLSQRRNPFDLFASIFRKKTRDADTNGQYGREDNSEDSDVEVSCVPESHAIISSPDRKSIGSPSSGLTEYKAHLRDGDNNQRSPASPPLRSLEDDMEALHLSRQDNPYLQQKLERFSLHGSMGSSTSFSVPWAPAQEQQKLIEFEAPEAEPENHNNLHEHLVRSPPPQFPQHIARFVFPTQSVSPHRLGAISHVNGQNASSSETGAEKNSLSRLKEDGPVFQVPATDGANKKEIKKVKDLNPILTKSGVSGLDPKMREILEFQKQKITKDQRKDTISPVEKVVDLPAVQPRSLPLAAVPQGRWSIVAASRSSSLPTIQPITSVLSGSLVSLTSNEQESRSTVLAPVKGAKNISGVENLAFK